MYDSPYLLRGLAPSTTAGPRRSAGTRSRRWPVGRRAAREGLAKKDLAKIGSGNTSERQCLAWSAAEQQRMRKGRHESLAKIGSGNTRVKGSEERQRRQTRNAAKEGSERSAASYLGVLAASCSAAISSAVRKFGRCTTRVCGSGRGRSRKGSGNGARGSRKAVARQGDIAEGQGKAPAAPA